LTRRTSTGTIVDLNARAEPARHRHWGRWRIAGGIAVVEGIVVALSGGISRWTVIALAAAAVFLYVTWGRQKESGAIHTALWIFAASQVFAVVITVASWYVSWLAYALAAILALFVLVLLALDR
jgi:hypothetical protein